MRSALFISESTGRCSRWVTCQARAAARSAAEPASATISSHVRRVRPALSACSRPARLTSDTGAACSSDTVTVPSVCGMPSMTARTGAVTSALSAPGAGAALRCQAKRRRPELPVTEISDSVASSRKGCSRRAMPLTSAARRAPMIESAACAAMLCARAWSSGSSRSRVVRSASKLRVRVSAACRSASTPLTAAAASTTTRKAPPAYLNLKLAVVTCVACASSAGTHSSHGRVIPPLAFGDPY